MPLTTRERERREYRIERLMDEPLIQQLARECRDEGVDADRWRDRWAFIDRRFSDAVWDEVVRRDENEWIITPDTTADEPAEAVLRILAK